MQSTEYRGKPIPCFLYFIYMYHIVYTYTHTYNTIQSNPATQPLEMSASRRVFTFKRARAVRYLRRGRSLPKFLERVFRGAWRRVRISASAVAKRPPSCREYSVVLTSSLNRAKYCCSIISRIILNKCNWNKFAQVVPTHKFHFPSYFLFYFIYYFFF